MPSPIHSIFYVSRAAPHVGAHEIRSILGAARRRNRQLDLTGLLAHAENCFAQVLEGPAEALAAVIASIAKDARHDQLRVVYRGESDRRQYAQWEMGYIEGFGAAEQVQRWIDGEPADEAQARAFAQRLFSSPQL